MNVDMPSGDLGPLALGLAQRKRQPSHQYRATSGIEPPAVGKPAAAPVVPSQRPRPLGESNAVPRQPMGTLQRPSTKAQEAKVLQPNPKLTVSLDSVSWRAICAEGRAEADRKRGVQLPMDDRSEFKQWLFHDIMQRQGHPLPTRGPTPAILSSSQQSSASLSASQDAPSQQSHQSQQQQSHQEQQQQPPQYFCSFRSIYSGSNEAAAERRPLAAVSATKQMPTFDKWN